MATELIVAIISALATTYTTVSNADAASKAQKTSELDAAAAAKNKAIDDAKAAADAKNNALDTRVADSTSTGTTLAEQVKARVAAGQDNAPGMSTGFYTDSQGPNQYPGFAGLVSDVVNPNSQNTGTG